MLTFLLPIAFSFASCDASDTNETGDGNDRLENESGVENSLINAEGAENNPYNLPGEDTGAIHENTTTQGTLDMDAREDTSTRR